MTEHFAEFFPGSKRPIVRETQAAYVPPEEERWDAKPRKYSVPGKGEMEFFTSGQLAKALNRKAVSIRRWEREGIIPKSTFQKPGSSGDVRGRRRLYSRAQVEGIVNIAREEGVLEETWKPIPKTFTARIVALFRELSRQ